MSKLNFLPYGRQCIEDDDIAAVAAVLRSDFLTTGPKVEEFEAGFARATSARHAVACNSGTAALHLAVLTQDLSPRDAVVVPTMTFVATANVVRMAGAEVVFADVDARTGLLTAELLHGAIERAKAANLRPRLALPVHLGGQLCKMADLSAVASANGVSLIEDACHALGVPDIGATPNSLAACFSTHPVKAIATGEGGTVTTNDGALAERMRRLRNHGLVRDPSEFQNAELAFDTFDAREPSPWYYEMPEIGWNYRIPDVLCALGISQIKKLDGFWRRRSRIAELYDRQLAPLAPVLQPVSHGREAHGWHLYAVLIDFERLGTTRRNVISWLQERGIGTQVHYIPVHRQPYYRQRYGALNLPGADDYYARCLSLPMFPAMADSDVLRVSDALAMLVGKNDTAAI